MQRNLHTHLTQTEYLAVPFFGKSSALEMQDAIELLIQHKGTKTQRHRQGRRCFSSIGNAFFLAAASYYLLLPAKKKATC